MEVPVLGKFKQAKRMLAESQREYDAAKRDNERHRKQCEAELAALGAENVAAMELELRPFVKAFNKLRNVELGEIAEVTALPVDELTMEPLRSLDFDEWDVLVGTTGIAPVIAEGASAAVASGAATGAAVWTAGVVGASATTGTAISSLSGAAATNATLAWLGGGSVAAGGGGVAMGTAVLTGAVAGAFAAPVLIVGGVFVNRKGKHAVLQAEANADRVDEFVAQLDSANKVLDRTSQRATDMAEALGRLRVAMDPGVANLQKWVAKERNFRRYSAKRQKEVATTFALASVAAGFISTPLTTRKGNLTTKSAAVLKQAKAALGSIDAEVPREAIAG